MAAVEERELVLNHGAAVSAAASPRNRAVSTAIASSPCRSLPTAPPPFLDQVRTERERGE
jgi:hypothetical protein